MFKSEVEALSGQALCARNKDTYQIFFRIRKSCQNLTFFDIHMIWRQIKFDGISYHPPTMRKNESYTFYQNTYGHEVFW